MHRAKYHTDLNVWKPWGNPTPLFPLLNVGHPAAMQEMQDWDHKRQQGCTDNSSASCRACLIAQDWESLDHRFSHLKKK